MRVCGATPHARVRACSGNHCARVCACSNRFRARVRVWENFSSHCIHAVVAMVRAKYGEDRALAFIAHFVQAAIALEHAQDAI